MASDVSPRQTDPWLPHDEEEADESLSDASAWLSWLREDVKVQGCAWLLASMAVLRQAWTADSICLGLAGYLFENQFGHCLVGWCLATSLSLAWLLLDLQMVFTSEQRAMRFPPWSILVFVKHPAQVGSVVIFLGYDGRSYVRRVKAIHECGPALQTVGDLPGAPDDQPLYSADGSANWLDPSAVRGTLAAGPFPLQQVLKVVLAFMILSPAMAFSFFVTSQPIVMLWLMFLCSLAWSCIFSPMS
ncbi:unnamed protein product [Cladocopium goreaui]|uniref:Peptidase S26 domain-containing protein n=1 Tax=Cladocopium goreaui TaxID=2562237 RepID=A0A9P1C580_9DINO|nr:unnamed protein product [Cladocopium goreaui]|mmetsp:Transcript_77625/g.171468  ORF Transcript_77625/g.171468 Transcript_77625/m.171468 type:complete len:245 (+) Transcript_77625:43-777(+)